MSVGRYLASDTADRIGQFGNAIGDMAGTVLDWQTMVARRTDAERRRRIEESREERLRLFGDLDEQRRTMEMESELAAMSPERRRMVAGTLAPKWRHRFGFADAVPPVSLEVQPPDAAGPGARPATLETRGAPFFDPYAGLPADESIEYRGSTFPTRDEYLGFRTEEERARYAGRPDGGIGGSGSSFRPTGSDINNILDPLASEMSPLGVEVPTIPPGDRARLYGGARAGRIDIEALPDSVAAIKGRMPADDVETGGGQAEVLPGLFPIDKVRGALRHPIETAGRVGRFLGDRLETVERIRSGEPSAPPELTDDQIEEMPRLIRAALAAGRTHREIAATIAADLGISEADARLLVTAAELDGE